MVRWYNPIKDYRLGVWVSSDNLLIKLADEHLKFLASPTWAIIKYRHLERKRRLLEYITNHVRNKEHEDASRVLGMVDDIDEFIKLTERLDKDIIDKTFDVDAALSVIENKQSK